MSAADVMGRLFDVRGKRAVVTGAASGLGLAFAEVLADCGARVTLADIDVQRLEAETERLAANGCDVRSTLVDVADPASVDACFDELVEVQGGVDIAFANAGIAGVPGFAAPSGEELQSVDDRVWREVLSINQDGVLYTMRAAAAVMKPQRSGRIIVTASTAGLVPEALVCYAYAAAKASVIMVAKQAARELAPYGVHVNVIAPGPTKTRIAGGVTPEIEQMWSSLIPLDRMGEPEELKGLALLLSSPASSFITGGVFTVDGGQVLGQPGEW